MEDFKPEITRNEVEQYENTFMEKVTPNVKFHKYDNGLSMELYKGDSGSEAVFSGIISLNGDNNIHWNYSIQNGLSINSKTELNDEILDIMNKLASFYKEWESYWSKALNMPKADVDAETVAPEAAPTPEATPGASSLQENDSTKKRKLSIMNSFERMKLLSGVK